MYELTKDGKTILRCVPEAAATMGVPFMVLVLAFSRRGIKSVAKTRDEKKAIKKEIGKILREQHGIQYASMV